VTFPHEQVEFHDLVRVAAENSGFSAALVEKDYWVTHTLWALQESGLDLWVKGGTSLSKGFGLIQRFSEDLDLRIEPGSVETLAPPDDWTSRSKAQVRRRTAYFESLTDEIAVPGATIAIQDLDDRGRGATYEVHYPGRFLDGLAPAMRPYVQIEAGIGCVTPFVPCDLSSVVHDYLDTLGELQAENTPCGVRCLHPLVTLLDKLDAISRRFGRGDEPGTFVRHYEDAWAIAKGASSLPPLETSLPVLVEAMVARRELRRVPRAEDPAWKPDAERLAGLRKAHDAISLMFWGRRRSIPECGELIRMWIESNL